MADGVIHTRSLGTGAEGVRDQYADGKAAKVWEVFIGDKKSRTENYKKFLVGLLRAKGCKKILDVACGTGGKTIVPAQFHGNCAFVTILFWDYKSLAQPNFYRPPNIQESVDSIMLLEEGFQVTSVDASDKMLKYALKARWNRRKEPAFDNWVIEEANWLTLYNDVEQQIGVGDGFDAVICLGNSFAHMMDSYGDQREQKQALKNFERCVKPGGLLLIDHRNYDHIISTGETPAKCIYYNSKHTTDIKTSVLLVRGIPAMVTLDYMIDTSDSTNKSSDKSDTLSEFRLSYYPHRLEVFKHMLTEAFGPKSRHDIYGDFKKPDEIVDPGFYIHVMEKCK